MTESFTPAILDDIKRTADLCVKCNICTSACPVVPVTDLFPGPKYVGPQAQRFRHPGMASPDHALDYCSGCGVCTLVCPHGVKVMEINTAAKAELRKRELREHPLDRHLWRNWLLGRNELLGKLGGMVAPLANLVMGLRLTRVLMEWSLGIDRRAPFPRFHFTTFRRWFFRTHARGKATALPDAPKVAYFHGCATNHYELEVGKAIVAVLEHNGYEVVLPEQNCCGLPMQSNGDFDGARRYALANLRLSSCGRIVYSWITLKMFRDSGARREHTDGIIDQLRIIKNIKVAVLIVQEGVEQYKVSFRTVEPIPANEIASQLGGGGHPRAAGATRSGNLEKVIDSVLKAATSVLNVERNE